MTDTAESKPASPPLAGMLAKVALVAMGGGGLLAVDQFGLIDGLLGGDTPPVVEAVAKVVEDVPAMSSAMNMVRGGVYDGLSWAMHGAVDAILYPFKVAKEGF